MNDDQRSRAGEEVGIHLVGHFRTTLLPENKSFATTVQFSGIYQNESKIIQNIAGMNFQVNSS